MISFDQYNRPHLVGKDLVVMNLYQYNPHIHAFTFDEFIEKIM